MQQLETYAPIAGDYQVLSRPWAGPSWLLYVRRDDKWIYAGNCLTEQVKNESLVLHEQVAQFGSVSYWRKKEA